MWTALVEGHKIDLSVRDDEIWFAIRRERLLTACTKCGGRAHPIAIPGVDGEGHPTELRVFGHNPGQAERCRLLGGDESPEHHGLKASIAAAIRSTAGWTAELEVTSSDERCRADVVAHGPSGQTWALEAQLARLALPDASARHERYVGEWSNATWVHTGRREWAVRIPSLRVDSEERTQIVGGLYVDDAGEISAPPISVNRLIPRLVRHERIEYIHGDEREEWGFYRDLSIQPAADAMRSRTPPARVLTGASVTNDCTRPTAPVPGPQRVAGEHLPAHPRYPVRGSHGFCQWCRVEVRWDGNRWGPDGGAPCRSDGTKHGGSHEGLSTGRRT